MSDHGWTDEEWESHLRAREAYEKDFRSAQERNRDFFRRQDRRRLIANSIFTLLVVALVWVAWWALKLAVPALIEAIVGFPTTIRNIVHSVFSVFH